MVRVHFTFVVFQGSSRLVFKHSAEVSNDEGFFNEYAVVLANSLTLGFSGAVVTFSYRRART